MLLYTIISSLFLFLYTMLHLKSLFMGSHFCSETEGKQLNNGACGKRDLGLSFSSIPYLNLNRSLSPLLSDMSFILY